MSLKKLQGNWNHFGEQDPLFAVLTDPQKKGGKWDQEDFYATGRAEIARLFEDLARLDIEVRRDRALDFGCGAGRLSQALAGEFARVVGIDIAPSMVALATRNNPAPERISFVLNEADSLPFEQGSFDFVYSNYVLQHIAPRYAKTYVAEFLRVLAPGGVAVFQFTSAPRSRLKRWLASCLPPFLQRAQRRLRFGKHYMEMHGIPKRDIESIVAGGGARVQALEDVRANVNWQSHVCYAIKEG